MFIEKPSKKDYPDYYKVITQPMDMETIDEKIKKNQYTTSDEALADFKLMFNNCRRWVDQGHKHPRRVAANDSVKYLISLPNQILAEMPQLKHIHTKH